MSFDKIEAAAAALAAASDDLSDHTAIVNAEIEQIKQRERKNLHKLAAKTVKAMNDLHAAIKEAPELFEKPRTRVFSNIKCGMTKQRGKVVIDDEEKTIARIRSLLPKDQVELLIIITEKVAKSGVYDLTAADLKRLGIRIEDDTDAVVIKPAVSDIQKLIDSWLEEANAEEAA